MCGIAGIVGKQMRHDREGAVRRMTQRIAHRGPDGEGFFHDRRFSFGHRRLSIIDLESGKQPLANEDESIWLTFNGEIYNYRELREQLRAAGHVFKTQSDSEVIVHAYEQWGPDCVERFRGMFAFGLVDKNTNRLMLARDQLGIKPLYYRCSQQRTAFSSELPAVLQAFEDTPKINLQSIDYFLRYRYIPAPDTAYDGIHKLPPATYQIYDLEGKKLWEREYWKLTYQPEHGRSDEEWTEQFEEVLMDSVRAHLVADVPFGAFLSGGIDSTLIVAMMAKLLNKEVRAYTIDFDEQPFSERKFATEAAQQLGVSLQHDVVRPDLLGTLQELFNGYGEPFADTSAVPTRWVSELARRDVPMVLSGDGADEGFAGYHRYARWMDASLWSDTRKILKAPKRLLRCLMASAQLGVTTRRRQRWEQDFVGVFQRRWRQQLWQPDHHELIDRPCPAFVAAAQEVKHLDKLTFAQHLDIKTYLPGDILTKVDIASMQYGLEVRTPFTDVRVMEFAATLPRTQRCQGMAEQRRLKVLPKRLLSRSFPPQFIEREKKGFGIPMADWLGVGSPVRGRFDDLVASPNSPLFDLFQRSAIEKRIASFDQRGDCATELWSVFILAMWLEQHAAASSLKAAA